MSDLTAFFDVPLKWGTEIEKEIKNRIKLSVYAYAYEFQDDSLVSDNEFDKLSYNIKNKVKTGNLLMDNFFDKVFEPHTGSWIQNHPELVKIGKLYLKHYKKD